MLSAWWEAGANRFGIITSKAVDASTINLGAAMRLRIADQRWGAGAATLDSPTEVSWARGTGPAIDAGPDHVYYVPPPPGFGGLRFADGTFVSAFSVPWVAV